jgi:hypothetical protein
MKEYGLAKIHFLKDQVPVGGNLRDFPGTWLRISPKYTNRFELIVARLVRELELSEDARLEFQWVIYDVDSEEFWADEEVLYEDLCKEFSKWRLAFATVHGLEIEGVERGEAERMVGLYFDWTYDAEEL